MGTNMWWFYDVIAVAIILVCVYYGGAKGVVKGLASAVCCGLAILVAFFVSGAVSHTLYDSALRNSNIKKLQKSIEPDEFTNRYAAYLESMGYNIKVKKEKLNAIFDGKGDYDKKLCKYVNNVNARPVEKNETVLMGKIHEGYAVVIADMIGESLNKYAAESAAQIIREDSSGMAELIPLLCDDENSRAPAVYIADHYTAEAYSMQFRLVAFSVLYVVIVLLSLLLVGSLMNSRDDGGNVTGLGSRIMGGLFGIASGAAMVFAAAAVVRVWTIMGSNEMLFFNHTAIDQSYVFKYFYEFAMNM